MKSIAAAFVLILTLCASAGAADSPFENPYIVPLSATPGKMVYGDFNQDGRLDLAVACSNDSGIIVLINDNAGGFAQPIRYASGGIPGDMLAADFTGDSLLDLVATCSNDNYVALLKGNGDGSFDSPKRFEAGTRPAALAAFDADDDGDLDLAVANMAVDSLSFLTNFAQGFFLLSSSVKTAALPHAIVATKLSPGGSSIIDLVIGYANLDSVTVYSFHGHGLIVANSYLVSGAASALVATDLSGDGLPELATVSSVNGTITTLKNMGGALGLPVSLGSGRYPSAIAAGDFDGDHFSDLAIANTGENSISIFSHYSDGNFATDNHYPAGSLPGSLCAADFNGDGITDLVISNGPSKSLMVLLAKSTTTDVAVRDRPSRDIDFRNPYPNPFNPVTLVSFEVRVRTDISLVVYNTLGQKVKTLVDHISWGDGVFQTYWLGDDDDGNQAPSGVYLFRLTTPEFEGTVKGLKLK